MSLISYEKIETTESVKQIQYKTKYNTAGSPLWIHVDLDNNIVTGYKQISKGHEQVIHYIVPVKIGSGDPIDEEDLLPLLYTILQPSGSDNMELLQHVYDLHYDTSGYYNSSCSQCSNDLDTSQWTDQDYDQAYMDRDNDQRYVDQDTGDLVCSECDSARDQLLCSIDHYSKPSAYIPRGWRIDRLTCITGNIYWAIKYAFEAHYHIDIDQLLADLDIAIDTQDYS